MSVYRDSITTWLLFPAVTMSLGWGLRGFIGGGPLGAMIPGAMIALALALLLGRRQDIGLIAACGAVGIGFGGQETYGQTVGLSMQPETFWWAITGFAVKGAVWGLLGGIVIAMALMRASSASRRRDMLIGLSLMVAGTWAGWRFVNAPKLIYFSNRLDKPREEVWAGLLLGALALLIWMGRGPGARVLGRFAAWGALGGGAGFALGAAIQAWGRPTGHTLWLDWWKIMELTFGALLGAAYGWAAYRSRGEAVDGAPRVEREMSAWIVILGAAVLTVVGIGIEYKLGARFGYTVAGALLLAAALWSEALAWQVAMTVTCCAFFMDLAEARPTLAGAAGWWVIVVACSAGIALAAAKMPRLQPMFLLMTWCAVGVSLIKALLPPDALKLGALTMEGAFVLMGLACTAYALRTSAYLENSVDTTDFSR